MSINTKTGRKYDYFKDLVVPRACYFIVRLDGNCFSKFTERFERPFDEKFHKAMVAGTEKLITYIPDIYKAHFHSDEISLYFNKDSEWFDRRVQKITSITAGILSAKFSAEVDDEAHFDSRVLVTPTKKDVEAYEKDRRLNAWRGCINSYSYYKLRDSGLTARQATRKLHPMKSNDRQELLFSEFGINISKVPSWQRVGDFLIWEEYEKEGYNPVKKRKEKAIRRRIKHL
ncbi:MAG: tRNA(His) guanylyltransferase Thg1 family protein [archaeon]